jgi:mono/diheme cytochrome c family protein
MTKTIRSLVVLAAAVCMAGSMGFAQSSGAATYKAKCQACHGPSGTPSAGMAKMMGIKAASSPEMKKLTEAQMIKAVTDGKAKMPAFKGKLSDAQVKEVVAYFRTLK